MKSIIKYSLLLVWLGMAGVGVVNGAVSVDMSIIGGPYSMTASVAQGYNAASQTFAITSGTNTMGYAIGKNVPWMRMTPTNGVITSGQTVTISIEYSTAALAVGTSNAVITVVGTNANGSLATTNLVGLALTVQAAAMLGCNGVDLAATSRQGSVPSSAQFQVWNSSDAPQGWMSWTAATSVTWLSVSPASGRSAGDTATITVSFDTSGFGPGRYHGLITVSGVDETTGMAALRSPRELQVDLLVTATKDMDFFGDGSVADLVVYQESTGTWKILRVTDKSQLVESFGGSGYAPAPGDYDGSGVMDLGIYRAASQIWYMRNVGDEWISVVGQGGGTAYVPVRGDYDGDGRADFMLYAESTGVWYLRRSSDGAIMSGQFGGPGYLPQPGDYDGDGISDAALYDELTGNWYIITVGSVTIAWDLLWGGEGFTPVPGDYDGDGQTDLGAYHEGTGLWFLADVQKNVIGWWLSWGGPGFTPASGDYNGDGLAEIAIYQESSGLWYIRTVGGTILESGLLWGGPGYTPVK